MEKTNGGFLISKVKQIQDRVFDRLLAEHDIRGFNGAQGRILYVLWQEDNVPISRLSEKTRLAKTTLTSMLDRMEGAGFIKRSGDKSDRRAVNIRLTDAARDLRQRYEAVSSEMSEIFYRGFSDDEIFGFERSLGKILENLTEKENGHG